MKSKYSIFSHFCLLWQDVRLLLLSIVFALLSYHCLIYSFKYDGGDHYKVFVFLLVCALLFMGGLVYIVYLAIKTLYPSKEKINFIRGVRRVVFNYFSVIISYATIYFFLSIILDLYDAQSKNQYYVDRVRLNKSISDPIDKRAFKGLSHNPWASIQNPSATMCRDAHISIDKSISIEEQNKKLNDQELIALAKRDRSLTCKFRPETTLDIEIDCIYFSVITITTVGYGDISPSHWITKFTACTEALFGALFFVFSINLLFNSKQSEDESSETAD